MLQTQFFSKSIFSLFFCFLACFFFWFFVEFRFGFFLFEQNLFWSKLICAFVVACIKNLTSSSCSDRNMWFLLSLWYVLLSLPTGVELVSDLISLIVSGFVWFRTSKPFFKCGGKSFAEVPEVSGWSHRGKFSDPELLMHWTCGAVGVNSPSQKAIRRRPDDILMKNWRKQ